MCTINERENISMRKFQQSGAVYWVMDGFGGKSEEKKTKYKLFSHIAERDNVKRRGNEEEDECWDHKTWSLVPETRR